MLVLAEDHEVRNFELFCNHSEFALLLMAGLELEGRPFDCHNSLFRQHVSYCFVIFLILGP